MSEKTNDNGAEEVVAEEPVVEEPIGQEKLSEDEAQTDEAQTDEGVKGGPKAKEAMEAAGKTINDAFKQVEKQFEHIGKTLGGALQDRANVVMVRVNDDSLAYLDMLVDADITKSRSESAAFLINEGIKSNEALFNQIREITDQIVALRAQLRQTVRVEE